METVRTVFLCLTIAVTVFSGTLYAGPDYFHLSSDSIYYHRSDFLDRVLSRNPSQKGDSALAEDLRLDFELNDRLDPLNTKAFISLGTKPLRSDITDPSGWGIEANRSLVGTPSVVLLREAYIEVRYPAENTPFADSTVFFKAGIQDFHLPLRNSQAFFIDLARAESAYISPVTESFNGSAYQGKPLSGAPAAGLYRNTLLGEAGGFKLTYSPSQNVYLDMYSFNIMETLGDRSDEQVYGMNLDYHFGDERTPDNLANMSVSVISGDNSRIYTVGAGVDYFLRALEFYSEAHFQWGKYGELSGQDIAQDAYAYYAGGRFKFSKLLNFYIDASYWAVSGDNGDLSGGNLVNGDFVSYEGINTTLIMEDNTFGLDVDSNYEAVKLEFGISGRIKNRLRDDFKIVFLYGTFRLTEAPARAGLADGTPGLGLDRSLGNEVDFVFMWRYKPSLVISTGYGVLWDADFFMDDETFNTKSDKMNIWFMKFAVEF